ncbi:hypothetical protein FVA81_02775 (plasmid) [Rhizobium sp. WL3]|uniref:DUF995 domain-containing protein n=1 Tax=Rhizobium sp. WL3 TaxID=2603277 RepID=UPI0011C1E5DF|nr:DUF995 domain-containing protein [Rhizobium sp. WL3]QEE43573.1 hypothetical protein FVA81_02775 [Rhizobium sp. WL3]
MKIIKTLSHFAVALLATAALSACSTSGSNTSSEGNGSVTATKSAAQRERLSAAEVVSLYTGKTARGSGHSTTYKADGTWVNNSGATGRWRVSGDGTLVMTGGLSMSLQVFRDGNRYYHRNASSGAGGYYTLG